MSLWLRRRDLRTHLYIATVIKFLATYVDIFLIFFFIFLLHFIIVTINLIQLLSCDFNQNKLSIYLSANHGLYSNPGARVGTQNKDFDTVLQKDLTRS